MFFGVLQGIGQIAVLLFRVSGRRVNLRPLIIALRQFISLIDAHGVVRDRAFRVPDLAPAGRPVIICADVDCGLVRRRFRAFPVPDQFGKGRDGRFVLSQLHLAEAQVVFSVRRKGLRGDGFGKILSGILPFRAQQAAHAPVVIQACKASVLLLAGGEGFRGAGVVSQVHPADSDIVHRAGGIGLIIGVRFKSGNRVLKLSGFHHVKAGLETGFFHLGSRAFRVLGIGFLRRFDVAHGFLQLRHGFIQGRILGQLDILFKAVHRPVHFPDGGVYLRPDQIGVRQIRLYPQGGVQIQQRHIVLFLNDVDAGSLQKKIRVNRRIVHRIAVYKADIQIFLRGGVIFRVDGIQRQGIAGVQLLIVRQGALREGDRRRPGCRFGGFFRGRLDRFGGLFRCRFSRFGLFRQTRYSGPHHSCRKHASYQFL